MMAATKPNNADSTTMMQIIVDMFSFMSFYFCFLDLLVAMIM